MRKSLYGTTALVAAGVLAAVPAAAEEGVTLGLGGYYNTYFGVGDVDESAAETRDIHNSGLFADGEVHFKGSTTLDNGITFGVQIELEAFQSGDQIDENYAFVSGSFGRFVIGGENTAAYMMQYAAPNVGVPLNSGWITTFIPAPPGHVGSSGFRTPTLSTYVDIGNDNHGITYYSPRFSGFQIAASWVPVTGTSGNGTGDGAQGLISDDNTQINDVLSVGANFVQDFGAVNVAVAGGFRRATGPDNLTAAQDESIEQWSGGLNIGFAGFTVGGSFALEDSERLIGGQSVDGIGYDLGVSYATGPWAVGATYFHSEVEGLVANSNEDELDSIEAGVSYAIGPGIKGSVSGIWAEWEDEASDEQEGIVGVVGMKISF